MTEIDDGKYKKVSALVDDWLQYHKGERFDLDMICRQLDIREPANRKLVSIKLAYEVKKERLEKLNRYYNIIDNTLKYINWVNSNPGNIIDLSWPHGHESEEGFNEDSRFGFDDCAVVSEGDLIVVTGDSNVGKTTFAHNIVWENMDKYPCRLMGNEYVGSKFRRRIENMKWKNPLKEDGNPKFELIERRDGWHYAIEPDSINVIDWILLSGEPGSEFYTAGAILDRIQAKLKKGIAIVVLQKSPGKVLARGGGPTVDLSSLYLTIDYNRLTVVKCKEWKDHNPDKEIYGFTIVNHGCQFHNIRPIKRCPKCQTTGYYKGETCDSCNGTGYMDKKS